MGCSFVSIPNEICNTIFKGITGFPSHLPIIAYQLFYWFNILAPYWLLPRKDSEKGKNTRLLPAICLSFLQLTPDRMMVYEIQFALTALVLKTFLLNFQVIVLLFTQLGIYSGLCFKFRDVPSSLGLCASHDQFW